MGDQYQPPRSTAVVFDVDQPNLSLSVYELWIDRLNVTKNLFLNEYCHSLASLAPFRLDHFEVIVQIFFMEAIPCFRDSTDINVFSE